MKTGYDPPGALKISLIILPCGSGCFIQLMQANQSIIGQYLGVAIELTINISLSWLSAQDQKWKHKIGAI